MNIIKSPSFISKFAILITLFAFTGAAYAEYYVVYSTPSCSYCQTTVYKKYKKHHVKKHVKKHYVKKHVYRPRDYTVTVSYTWQPAPCGCAYTSCSSCNYNCSYAPPCGCVNNGSGRWVKVRTQSAYDEVYYYNDNVEKYDSYDPDMSTGDDDATVYPGMDIDR